jgi:hypothetical protein
MSLDVDLLVTKPTSVWTRNITHNLGAMAKAVVVDPDKDIPLTLYDVLWRPEEHDLVLAHEIVDYLDLGWNMLMAEPEKYKAFNPENGWGNYEGLCDFVYHYRNACWDNPFAELSVSR